MPLSEEMRRAIAILDGTARSQRAAPDAPGFQWSPRGHRLVLSAALGSDLSLASHAELAIFGDSRLAFGVAVRLADPAGARGAWWHTAFCWGTTASKWPVPPIADARLVPWEERALTIAAMSDPAAGQPTVVREMPLGERFAMVLRTRVAASRESAFSASQFKSLSEQLGRSAAGGIEQAASERFAGDLLPIAANH